MQGQPGAVNFVLPCPYICLFEKHVFSCLCRGPAAGRAQQEARAAAAAAAKAAGHHRDADVQALVEVWDQPFPEVRRDKCQCLDTHIHVFVEAIVLISKAAVFHCCVLLVG